MKLAFCLFKFFPHGGLGRDFLHVARECRARGHEVAVFASAWVGPLPADLDVSLIESRRWTNSGRCAAYAESLERAIGGGDYDAVVGFNRMPNLDVYFAADACHEADLRERRFTLQRYTPRHRLYSAFERSVFRADGTTEILVISEREMGRYMRYFGTPPARFRLLPPGVSRDRMRPDDASRVRSEVRAELGLADSDLLLLSVGTNFRIKGLERSLRALASLPRGIRDRVRLLVLGRDRPAPWERRARRLGIGDRVGFLGLRSDLPRLLWCADLLVHPASIECGGTVLVEALAAGLPVLTTEICGYARHVERAGAGIVVPEPFHQSVLDSSLLRMLAAEDLSEMRKKALDYAREADIFSLPERAADAIEEVAQRKMRQKIARKTATCR